MTFDLQQTGADTRAEAETLLPNCREERR